jgi:DNA primase
MTNEWVDFRAVKAAVSMAEVLHRYEVDWLRRRRPGQLEGRCPIHHGGRVDAFHVSLSKNAFQCFACQAHGNVLDFVAAMEQCSVREAARRLAHRFTIPCGAPAAVGRSRERSHWLGKNNEDNQPLWFTLGGIDGAHPYLRARDILPETAAQFGVGFYSGPGLMHGRVVIPIHDAHGRLVAYAGRALDNRPPKYRLPAGFHKSRVLFNFRRAAAADQPAVVVVEGYFDCLKVHQAGYRAVVALMGTVLSEAAEDLLLERFRQVILMLDGDGSGRKATERVAAELAGKCSVRIIMVPNGKQPDQLGSAEIRALLESNWDGTVR